MSSPPGLLLTLALVGCGGSSTVPQGSWVIQGHGILGGLWGQADALTVQLQSEAWSTGPEPVPARLVYDEDGSTWSYFSVETAAGPAEAALELDLEAGRGRLPLGFRDGEHVFVLTLTPGTPASPSPTPGLSELAQAWAKGGFTLRDGSGDLTGALVLLPGGGAQVQLVTPTALTDGRVAAASKSEGPDLLLAFPVEPQFADENGLMRLNLPTMKLVLPVDHQPHPNDHWLEVSAGPPDPEQLAARIQQVRKEALQAEKALLTRLGPELSGAALEHRSERGQCPSVEELAEAPPPTVGSST